MKFELRPWHLAILMVLAGCGAEPAGPLLACTAPVEMTLTTESILRIQWTPRCGATELSVMKPSSGGLVQVWYVSSTDALIPPDVRLFQTPPGTSSQMAPEYPAGPSWVVVAKSGSIQVAHEAIGF